MDGSFTDIELSGLLEPILLLPILNIVYPTYQYQ